MLGIGHRGCEGGESRAGGGQRGEGGAGIAGHAERTPEGEEGLGAVVAECREGIVEGGFALVRQYARGSGGFGEATGTEQALNGGECRQKGGVGEAAVGLRVVESGGAGADGGDLGEGFPASEVGEQAFHTGGKVNDGLRGGLGQHEGAGAGAVGGRLGGGDHGVAPGVEGGEQIRQFQQGEVRGEMGVLVLLPGEEGCQAAVDPGPAGAGLSFDLAGLLPQFPQQGRGKGWIEPQEDIRRALGFFDDTEHLAEANLGKLGADGEANIRLHFQHHSQGRQTAAPPHDA